MVTAADDVADLMHYQDGHVMVQLGRHQLVMCGLHKVLDGPHVDGGFESVELGHRPGDLTPAALIDSSFNVCHVLNLTPQDERLTSCSASEAQVLGVGAPAPTAFRGDDRG